MPQDNLYTATKVNSGNHTRVYSGKAATLFYCMDIHRYNSHDSLCNTSVPYRVYPGYIHEHQKSYPEYSPSFAKTPAILSKIKESILCRGSLVEWLKTRKSSWLRMQSTQTAEAHVQSRYVVGKSMLQSHPAYADDLAVITWTTGVTGNLDRQAKKIEAFTG